MIKKYLKNGFFIGKILNTKNFMKKKSEKKEIL